MQFKDDLTNRNLAEQSYWDDAYANHQLTEVLDAGDIVKAWLLKYVPPIENGTCFEVGCFPGRYLTVLGKLGYELNGLDLTPRVLNDFPIWLKSLGYKTGEFVQKNFLEFSSAKKYDVVCSFGFIEHFTNWEEIFVKHIELVKPGGYLVIETPNFKGLAQRIIHYFLDRENYNRHYLPAMSPKKWSALCRKHGFEIIHSGYIGEFQFWVDKEPTTYFKRKFFQALIDYYPRLRRLPPEKKMYSPYCGIVARLNQKHK